MKTVVHLKSRVTYQYLSGGMPAEGGGVKWEKNEGENNGDI